MNKLDEIRQRLDATSTDLRDLLAVAEAAQEVLAQWDIGEIKDSAGVLDALDATFARLDTAELTS